MSAENLIATGAESFAGCVAPSERLAALKAALERFDAKRRNPTKPAACEDPSAIAAQNREVFANDAKSFVCADLGDSPIEREGWEPSAPSESRRLLRRATSRLRKSMFGMPRGDRAETADENASCGAIERGKASSPQDESEKSDSNEANIAPQKGS